jgi:glutaredoxin
MWSWFARRSQGGPAVVMYTRQGCHLCEDAWAILEAARKRHAFLLVQVDVDTDPALAEQYGMQVPVVTVNGQVRFRGHVNAVLLDRLLRAAAAEQPPRDQEGGT